MSPGPTPALTESTPDMLKSFLFRWIARSSDSLVAFIISLDAELDKFLAKHDAEVAGFEQDIIDAREAAEAEAKRIIDEAEETVKDITSTIEAKANAARILLNLKKSLPTGE